MPYRYSAELRIRICQRMLASEKVADLASEFHISPGTLHRWKKQALIDDDLLPGVKSFESDELAKAKRTIKDLEDELELVKAATASAVSLGLLVMISVFEVGPLVTSRSHTNVPAF